MSSHGSSNSPNPLWLYAPCGGADHGPSKLGGVSILGFAFDPTVPELLYAATGDGVFKSTNGGQSWLSLNNGLTDRNIEVVAIDPHDTSILYTAAYGGLFKTTTAGANWAPANTGLPTNTHPYFLL